MFGYFLEAGRVLGWRGPLRGGVFLPFLNLVRAPCPVSGEAHVARDGRGVPGAIRRAHM